MCGTIFLNFSVRNLRIARMVRAELNAVRALRLRRGIGRQLDGIEQTTQGLTAPRWTAGPILQSTVIVALA